MSTRSGEISVLHVDDNKSFLEVASTVLEREGENLSVTTETTPDTALERLAEQQFDCLVSDYDMGFTNGIEFLESVRTEYPDLPFILFTGKGSEEVAAEAISAGATDYIQKSGDTSQYTVLVNRIENLVMQYRARNRSEQANRRRRRTLERITDGFIELDSELTITDANSQTVELVGGSMEDVIGRNYRDLVQEDSENVFLTAYEEVLETGEEQTVQARSDIDSSRWLEERIFPTEDGDGIFVYFRDITERKRRDELQKIIIDSSSQLIDADEAEIDAQIEKTLQRIGEFEGADRCYVFRIYNNNERMDNTHEWCAPGIPTQKPELQNLSTAAFSWFIPKVEAFETVTVPSISELPDEASYLKRTLESGGIESIITIPLTRGGELMGFIGFDWTEQQEPWSDETITLLEVSSNIISNALARKDQIASRKAREETLSALHETAREIGRADDPATVYDTLTETAEDVFGLNYAAVDIAREDNLVQVSCVDSEPAEFYEQTSLDEDDTFATRAYNRQETIVVDDLTDTGVEPAESEYRSVLTVPIGEFGTFQTVSTDPGAFDDEDREFIELLTDHARIKLNQLADKEQLQQQTGELERKNAQLEKFTTVVSHDLKNPLNALQLSIDAAEETGEGEHFNRARQAADRMERLLEDLLVLAREGETIDDREHLSLASVVRDVWKTIDTEDKALAVETEMMVDADRTRLEELVANILRNAVKHGERTSNVVVGECADGFYIADDGSGIPEDERKTVFEAGYSTDEGGTGFGLAIVDEIAEAHGWDITVQESQQGGARFEIHTA